jgi:hypothetical protein
VVQRLRQSDRDHDEHEAGEAVTGASRECDYGWCLEKVTGLLCRPVCRAGKVGR